MRGDRVKIGKAGAFHESGGGNLTFVYRPRMDPDKPGHFLVAGDGSVIIESAGGVTVGCMGAIVGDPIKVHRTQLKDYNGVAGLGTNDFTLLFPVFLEKYQKEGWFPSDEVKVVEGGRA